MKVLIDGIDETKSDKIIVAGGIKYLVKHTIEFTSVPFPANAPPSS